MIEHAGFHEMPIEQMKKHVELMGSPDLSAITPEARQELWQTFSQERSHLPDQELADYMEEFLTHDVISDAQALEVAEQGNDEVKRRIAVAIGQSLEPTKFVQTFYECWPVLAKTPASRSQRKPRHTPTQPQASFGEDQTQTETLQSTFIERFTKLQPEFAIMVAPFVDLGFIRLRENAPEEVTKHKGSRYEKKKKQQAGNNVKKKTSKEHRGKWEQERSQREPDEADAPETKVEDEMKAEAPPKPAQSISILEKTFGSLDGTEQLIQAFIAYIKRHPEAIQQEEEKRNFPWKKRLNQSTTYIQRTLGVLFQRAPFIVTHHKQALAEQNIYPSLDNALSSHSRDQSIKYLTAEEQQTVQTMEKTYIFSPYTPFFELKPAKAAREYTKLINRGKTRQAEYLLESDTYQRVEPKKRLDTAFLLITEYDQPLLAQVERLGLSKQEVAQLIRRLPDLFTLAGSLEELKSVLAFNRAHPTKPDLEKECMTLVLRDMKNDDRGLYANIDLVMQMQELQILISPDSYQRLARTITTYQPHLWIFNPQAAVQEGVTSKQVLKRAQETDTSFFQNYNRYRTFVATALQQGDDSVSQKKLEHLFKKYVFEDPQVLNREECQQSVSEVLSPTDRQELYHTLLQDDILDWQFFQLLVADTDNEFQEELKAIALKRPDIVANSLEVSGHMINLKKMHELLGTKTFIDSILSQKHLQLDHFFGHQTDPILFKEITKPQRIERILEIAREHDQVGMLLELLPYLQKLIKPETSNVPTELQYDITREQGNAYFYSKQLETLTDQQSLELYSEKLAEIQKKLHRLKKKEKTYSTESVDQIPEDVRAQLLDFRERIKTVVVDACEKDPFFVFQKGILTNGEVDLRSFAKQHIDAYAQRHPTVLLHQVYTNNRWSGPKQFLYQDILGAEHFHRLVNEHLHAIAFSSREFEQDQLPVEIREAIERINPLKKYQTHDQQKHLNQDYYDLAINDLKKSAFFSLHKDTLERIAVQQQKLFGQQVELRAYWEPEPTFARLSKELLVLDASPIIRQEKERLIQLPDSTRKRVLQALVYLSEHDLDHKLGKVFELPDNQWQAALYEQVGLHLAEVFQVEPPVSEALEQMDFNALLALEVYFTSTCDQSRDMREAFQLLLSHVFNGTFEEWRMWGGSTTPETHEQQEQRLTSLKRQGLVPTNISLQQYQQWNTPERSSLEETLKYELKDIIHGVQSILDQATVDEHIERDVLNTTSFEIQKRREKLTDELRSLTEEKKALEQQFAQIRQAQKSGDTSTSISEQDEQRHEEIKNTIRHFKEEHADELLLLDGLTYLKQLKHLSPKELESQQLQTGKSLIPFSTVFKTLREGLATQFPLFEQDIQRIQQTLEEGYAQLFGGETVSKSKLVITDAVDLNRHTRIGESPVPSCQHYESGGYNQGLLSYMADPNVRVIQIEDETGRLITRSVLRLLEDAQGNPALFLERVYSVNAHERITHMVINLALAKAETMGVSLYSRELTKDEDEKDQDESHASIRTNPNATLFSKGSRTPYVYTDAGGGLKEQGIFTVSNPRLLSNTAS